MSIHWSYACKINGFPNSTQVWLLNRLFTNSVRYVCYWYMCMVYIQLQTQLTFVQFVVKLNSLQNITK